jgi:curli production assembly/transport component CsgF
MQSGHVTAITSQEMYMRYSTIILTAVALGLGASLPASAGSLVYHPVNPAFGGNPLNGTPLLSQAQAQGEGVKSGPQGPDLSGLNNALGNLGSGAVIVGGNGTGANGTGGATSNARVP